MNGSNCNVVFSPESHKKHMQMVKQEESRSDIINVLRSAVGMTHGLRSDL